MYSKNTAIHSSTQTPVWPSVSGSISSCYINNSICPRRKCTCLFFSLQNQICSEAIQHHWVLSRYLGFVTPMFYNYILLLYVQKLVLLSIFGTISSYSMWNCNPQVGQKLLVQQHLFRILQEHEKPKMKTSPSPSLVSSTSWLLSKCLLIVCSLPCWRDRHTLAPSLYKGPDSRMGAPAP